MNYAFYSVSLAVLVVGTVLYITRARWQHRLPELPLYNHFYQRLPSSFQSDIESGLHSTNFDLSSNLLSDDGRQGLDENAKREVTKIMKRKHISFDEARRLYIEQRFAKNGIGPDGMPMDPKFVSFS